MKKILSLILGLMLFILGGCTARTIKTEMLSNTPNLVKIEVLPKVDFVGPKGVSLSIENLTDKVLAIDWNSSSLDGDSIVTDGQMLKNMNTLTPKTVIAPFSTTTKSINKTSNINFSMGQWSESDVIFPVKLVLSVTVDDKQEYIILNLSEEVKAK